MKKISKNQKAGYTGEADFAAWATKMEWFPTKLSQDHGIDYSCQIKGNNISSEVSEMPGNMLNVSVRSTTEDGKYIRIDRSDAELFLNSKTPIVLAMVKRAPLGKQSEVAICFIDKIINDLENLLAGTNESLSIHFSDVMTDFNEIQKKVQTLFETEYKTRIDLQRACLKLQTNIPSNSVEIVHDLSGTKFVIKKDKNEFEQDKQTEIKKGIQSIGIGEVYFQDELKYILELEGHLSDYNHKFSDDEFLKAYSKSPISLALAVRIIRNELKAPNDILSRLRNEHKSNLNAHLLSAAIQTQCFEEPEKAFEALKKVVDLAKTKEEKEATLNYLLELWQFLNVKSANDCYALAMSLCEPNSLSALKFKAAKYLRNNQPDKVLTLLQELSENDPVILQMKGNAYWQKKAFLESANCFKKVAELVSSSEMYNNAGDFFLKGNNQLLAIECYEKAISLFPDNITALSNLAAIYTTSYIDLNKALKHLTVLNNLQPNDSDILVNIAICHARLFEPEKSLEYYDKACKIDKPILEAVTGKAELLITIKRENDALIHLELYKEQFKDNPNFSFAYMNTAYYAGHDDIANQIMMTIMDSQKKGKVSEEIIQTLDQNELIRMFKERAEETNDTNKNIHNKMLLGQFPWICAESINGNKNYYWGWLKRTQKLKWLFESPIDWANFTIYSTNGFHAQKDIDQEIRLLPIKSPSLKTTIVADISAILTLYQLNILDIVMAYFNRIVIPEEYLETALNQGKEVLLHQKSTYIAAVQIRGSVDRGILHFYL